LQTGGCWSILAVVRHDRCARDDLSQLRHGTPLTGHPEIAALLVCGFGLYLLLSMKRAYGQGWIRTPLKFVIVSTRHERDTPTPNASDPHDKSANLRG
jgi:hypothetical protein